MQTHEWNGLSRDQQLLWAFIKGVIVGHVEAPYISRKIGPVFHAIFTQCEKGQCSWFHKHRNQFMAKYHDMN